VIAAGFEVSQVSRFRVFCVIRDAEIDLSWKLSLDAVEKP